MKRTLNELLEKAKQLPPMTEEQKENQAVSFVYGNLQLSGINVTKEYIRRRYRELHASKNS